MSADWWIAGAISAAGAVVTAIINRPGGTPLRCWIGWHQWGELTTRTVLPSGGTSKMPMGRRCRACRAWRRESP